MKMFSIFDHKAKAYGLPFYQRQSGEAIRSFSDLANDEKSNVCKHPEDYTLFLLGDFDESTGVMELEKTPSPIAKAIEYTQTQLKAVN